MLVWFWALYTAVEIRMGKKIISDLKNNSKVWEEIGVVAREGYKMAGSQAQEIKWAGSLQVTRQSPARRRPC